MNTKSNKNIKKEKNSGHNIRRASNEKNRAQGSQEFNYDVLLKRLYNNVNYLDSVKYYADVESEDEDDDRIPISSEGITDIVEEITRDICKLILGHAPDVLKKYNPLEITEYDSVTID